MKWTSEIPTQFGLYLWRHNKDFLPHIALLQIDKYGYGGKKAMRAIYHTIHEYQYKYAEDIGGEWAGPIPEPEE